ncbi:3'-5'-exoribonuclease [Bachmanniomyces sp. S44760]|nr:3'-5'-exoribonuclease [Bachmanniomyces sp. S44760]
MQSALLPDQGPNRARNPNALRKIFLKTGLTPSASGSAYFELEPQSSEYGTGRCHVKNNPAVKLTCTVHGPRPLPRSAPFSPQMLLTTHIKFAPFASRKRRGYLRDMNERDLAVHLDTALRAIVIADRWPKSSADVIITVLEADEDERSFQDDLERGTVKEAGLMSILSGCITVASAAIVDAGIDCIDLVTGGVAAIAHSKTDGIALTPEYHLILDPRPSENQTLKAICVVAYSQARDELTNLWFTANSTVASGSFATPDIGIDSLIDGAVAAAKVARAVLVEAVKEAMVPHTLEASDGLK